MNTLEPGQLLIEMRIYKARCNGCGEIARVRVKGLESGRRPSVVHVAAELEKHGWTEDRGKLRCPSCSEVASTNAGGAEL